MHVRIAAAGLPLRTLQETLGHADIRMTMIYAHVQPAQALAQIRAIWEAAAEGRL